MPIHKRGRGRLAAPEMGAEYPERNSDESTDISFGFPTAA